MIGYARGVTDARLAALQALIGERLARSGGRVGMVFSSLATVMLASAMPILRYADGPGAFLEGVVARGVTAHLVLVSLPFALAVARLGKTWPSEPGLVALAAQRGFTEGDVADLVPGAAMRVAARRAALACAPLVVLAVVLALPDGSAAFRRLVATTLLVLLGALSAAGLAALGSLFAARARRVAGLALASVVVIPWVVALTVSAVPSYASLPGAYDAVRAQILVASSR